MSVRSELPRILLELDSKFGRVVDAAGSDSDAYLLEISGGVTVSPRYRNGVPAGGVSAITADT